MAPTLSPQEVQESLRGSAIEAVVIADKLVFVLYNEVVTRPDGVDVAADPALER